MNERLAPHRQQVRKIAVLRALQLGDMLVAVPALRSLRAGFPDAEITLIGLPWARAFARRYPRYLDRFVEFAGYPGIAEVPVEPARTARFLAEQRAYGFDLVVQLHGSGRASNPCALALGGAATAGYYEGEQPAGLAIGAPYPSGAPEILRNLGLARLLGCPDTGTSLEFPIEDDDRAEADALLEGIGPRPWIGIHPGARPPARRWSPERFAVVADRLVARTGGSVVLTGSADELATVRAVARVMANVPLVTAGRTSLGGLAALIAACDLFVGNDTGPAHLAVAVDTPSVVLFGPADHRRWAPLEPRRHATVRVPVACSPCPYWECPIDHRCLRRISADMVCAAAESLATMGAFR
ncbi:MAG TPA: glycosyltransferase family 9 protein [Thermomicrobiaceae bacterium]|nr:glycosyltransferase family 9 protein [Thermomicrobiaceae bacterium]